MNPGPEPARYQGGKTDRQDNPHERIPSGRPLQSSPSLPGNRGLTPADTPQRPGGWGGAPRRVWRGAPPGVLLVVRGPSALADAFVSATRVTRAALIEAFRPLGVSVCGSGRGVPPSAHADGYRAGKTPNWHTMMIIAAARPTARTVVAPLAEGWPPRYDILT